MTLAFDVQTSADSAAHLRAALARSLGRRFGAPRAVVRLERRPSPFCSSYALEELDVETDAGERLEMVFKNLSWGAMLEGAQRAKPAFLYDPLREIEAYRTVLGGRLTGPPACYGAVADAEAGRFWLFLEKVSGSKMRHVGEFEVWREVARWLARAHALFAAEAPSLARSRGPHLLRYDEDFFRLWMRRAHDFARQAERDRRPRARETLRRVERLSGLYERVLSHVAALPPTLVHGDFFASNIIARQEGARLRVCPVDWEMVGLGPGLLDLAALTSGSWDEAQRAALALDYRDALRSHGTQTYGVAALAPAEFLRALDCCYVCLAVQWLGWSADWEPPSDEAQDWLSVALRVVERLRL